jgi:crotonobetainyl-CoA:carnitine CoA-transferase CaiB-like acyl-CoA transferase
MTEADQDRDAMPPGALGGIRILDLSRLFAGPFAGQMLGDLGAEVIHVERAGEGDLIRSTSPPLHDRDGQPTRETANYLAMNRNKRGIAVDFTKPEGQQIIRDLAALCDVLIENFKVGDLARYGLDYDTIRAINPAIVYCSITGFGQTGPDRDQPGTDPIFQGRSGWMGVTGHPDGEPGGGPMRTGIYAIDLFGGCYAALGIVAALRWREARGGGEGQHIDLGLLDVALATSSYAAMQYSVAGVREARFGSRIATAVPGGLLECSDGSIMAMPGPPAQVRALFEALGCAELLNDQRFATNAARVEHRDILEPMLETRARQLERAPLVSALIAAGVPAGPVNDFAQAFEDPQLKAREMFVAVEHPLAGPIQLIGNPLRFSRTPNPDFTAPPVMGQDSDSVLGDLLGLGPEAIADLRARRVI